MVWDSILYELKVASESLLWHCLVSRNNNLFCVEVPRSFDGKERLNVDLLASCDDLPMYRVLFLKLPIMATQDILALQ